MISIIIPVFNKEEYIEKCIDSIMSQSYANVEIILVDDGSTDHSLEICNKCKDIDDRISVYSKINGGVSSARNFGLDIARGSYIMFIDPDDYIHRDLIELLKNCIDEEMADISYCFAWDVDEKKKSIDTKSKESGKKYVIDTAHFDWGGWTSHTTVWGALFRKSVVEGIRFDETISISEDTLFFGNCIKKADKVVCLDRALYYYFLNDSSITGQKYSSVKMDELRGWEMLCELFDRNSFSYRNAKVGYAQTAKNIIRRNCNYEGFKDQDYFLCKKIWYKNFGYEFFGYLHKREWISALKCLFSYFFWDIWLQREKKKVCRKHEKNWHIDVS